MNFEKKLKINKRIISLDNSTYFIADIAANHDGSLSRAKDLIFLAKECGADAVKFQHFVAENIVSDFGFKSLKKIKTHQEKWKKSVFEIYKKNSLNRNWNLELIKTAKKAKIDWLTTPYDYEAVDNLNKYLPAYKIGSGDITWLEFIKYIALKKKPLLIAVGASSFNDVDRVLKLVYKINKKICLMQCNTNYTGSSENFKYININVLKTFKKKFKNIILGLSDHTPGHTTVLGSITLGARVVEKHFTDKNSRNGPDHLFSMNPKSWSEMIVRSRELEESLGNGIKKVEKNEIDTCIVQRRCIRAKRDMIKGQIIKKNDLDALRPSPKMAIKPYEINKLIGKKLKRNKKYGSEFYIKDI